MIRHYSVLLQESIDALNCQSDGIYVDGTLGRGGHSLEIARRLQNGHLYAFDLDEQALAESAQRLAEVSGRVTLIRANFAQMREDGSMEQLVGKYLEVPAHSLEVEQLEQ